MSADREERVHLPIVKSSLRSDGSRDFVQPADVRGRFQNARRVVYVLLVVIWLLLPMVKIGGSPAVFLDIEHRRFFLFGSTFNAQDIWLVFFLLTGVAFGLVYLTALLGRVWCGWACPQTVFMEGFFRPIERLTEGPREARLRRNAGPWSAGKLARKIAKHALFLLLAFFVAHVFLGYFVSLPGLFRMVRGRPGDHPEAFGWAVALTGVFYVDFSWFREQMCLVVCPYGRMQSILVDRDSLVVGYDERRGEPRGKAVRREKKEEVEPSVGDCVDCKRCVVVCPTGIDIRNGLQMDCIGCTACIDACDEVMDKLERPRGLVRYDSLAGLSQEKKRVLRPRMYVYTALLLLGVLVASIAFRKHTDFEANVLRIPGAPFVLDGSDVRNAYEIHLINKLPRRETFTVVPVPQAGLTFIMPTQSVTLEPLASTHVPVFVTLARSSFQGQLTLRLTVTAASEPDEPMTVTTSFLGPTTP